MKRESLKRVFMPKKTKDKSTVLLLVIVLIAILLVYVKSTENTSTIPTTSYATTINSENLNSEFNITRVSVSYNNTNTTYYAYLASTINQQLLGYMNQSSIGNCNGMSPCLGMLFLFNSSQNLCFWMKNTEIPLNQVWVAQNGSVVQEYIGTPYSTAVVCATGIAVIETSTNQSIPTSAKISWQQS